MCICAELTILKNLNNLVGSANETMRVGVGSTLLETISVLNQYDMFMPHGMCHTVGVGGHWQTGGLGSISPVFGPALDYIVSFDIILSDQSKHSIVRPKQNTSDFNDDLFYAVLGGGPGSWGVVTQFEVEPLRNVDYPDSASYFVWWQFNKDVLRFLIQKLTLLSDHDVAFDHIFGLIPRIFRDEAIIFFSIRYVHFTGFTLCSLSLSKSVFVSNQSVFAIRRAVGKSNDDRFHNQRGE